MLRARGDLDPHPGRRRRAARDRAASAARWPGTGCSRRRCRPTRRRPAARRVRAGGRPQGRRGGAGGPDLTGSAASPAAATGWRRCALSPRRPRRRWSSATGRSSSAPPSAGTARSPSRAERNIVSLDRAAGGAGGDPVPTGPPGAATARRGAHQPGPHHLGDPDVRVGQAAVLVPADPEDALARSAAGRAGPPHLQHPHGYTCDVTVVVAEPGKRAQAADRRARGGRPLPRPRRDRRATSGRRSTSARSPPTTPAPAASTSPPCATASRRRRTRSRRASRLPVDRDAAAARQADRLAVRLPQDAAWSCRCSPACARCWRTTAGWSTTRSWPGSSVAGEADQLEPPEEPGRRLVAVPADRPRRPGTADRQGRQRPDRQRGAPGRPGEGAADHRGRGQAAGRGRAPAGPRRPRRPARDRARGRHDDHRRRRRRRHRSTPAARTITLTSGGASITLSGGRSSFTAVGGGELMAEGAHRRCQVELQRTHGGTRPGGRQPAEAEGRRQPGARRGRPGGRVDRRLPATAARTGHPPCMAVVVDAAGAAASCRRRPSPSCWTRRRGSTDSVPPRYLEVPAAGQTKLEAILRAQRWTWPRTSAFGRSLALRRRRPGRRRRALRRGRGHGEPGPGARLRVLTPLRRRPVQHRLRPGRGRGVHPGRTAAHRPGAAPAQPGAHAGHRPAGARDPRRALPRPAERRSRHRSWPVDGHESSHGRRCASRP